jgi:DHA1 family bicyclomycin/chloramphenicol resistance-like MFS transporter
MGCEDNRPDDVKPGSSQLKPTRQTPHNTRREIILRPTISSTASPQTKPVIERKQHNTILFVLAALSAIGPISVDMYLPGFPAIAADLKTDIAHVGLSLTSFFVGISIGQIAYGPLMDRYGRKKPLIVGLLIYIASALGCAFSPSIHSLVALRFFLALGGCVGMTGSRAVVRDLFSGSEIARVLSMLIMVFGIAPLIAPTIGGLVVATLGWRFIFLILAAIATFALVAVSRFLPESKGADASISLRPGNVLQEYLNVFREPAFLRYTLANAAAMAGFFSYITGSPFVYMKLFDFTETQFGWIYGANVLAMISASQINRICLKRRSSAEVLTIATVASLCVATLLLTGTLIGFSGRLWTPGLIFCFLFCFGFVNPNAMALALQPFTRNAGSASALIGSLQMVAGASASGLVSYLHNGTATPMVSVMAGSACISLVVLFGTALFMKKDLDTSCN